MRGWTKRYGARTIVGNTVQSLARHSALMVALVLSGSGCASVGPPTASTIELRQRLDSAMHELESRGFSGAVLVARGGERVLSSGYGLADRARGRPAGNRTLFQLASVSKQFTAAAVLALQQEGRLDVSDPIGLHLDEVPPEKRAITIHMLLTHTSGLPERVGECSSASAALDRDGYVRHVLSARLQSGPGSAFLYSNDGYGLLGAIIERASGSTYEDYLRKQLFSPAGMARTGYTFDEGALADAAIGYGQQRRFLGNIDPRFRNRDGPAWCNRASGGLLSTAEDMYQWHLALRDDTVLGEHARDAWWGRHVAESPARTRFHGYGWSLTSTARGRLAAHDGSLSGYYTAEVRWYLDEDVLVFVAANAAESPAPDASREIVRILFGRRWAEAGKLASPPRVQRHASPSLSPAAGSRAARQVPAGMRWPAP
jgi:CubicO group peptidase (beta-lactamase class C family)